MFIIANLVQSDDESDGHGDLNDQRDSVDDQAGVLRRNLGLFGGARVRDVHGQEDGYHQGQNLK